MNASAGQVIGLFLALGGAAAGLLVEGRRRRAGFVAVALITAVALIAGEVWNTPRLASLHDHPPVAVGVGLAIVAGLVALAAAFRRWIWAFPLAALIALPLRVPLQIGGETSSLLVPLYVVIGAGLIASAWGAPAGLGKGRVRDASVWVRRLLAAALVLYAIQSLYSLDVRNAIENAAFFFVPFASLLALLLEVQWTRQLLARALVVVGAMTMVLALIGIGEYFARHLILNQDLRAENSLHIYYRVNSLFRDPNIFGRYLALTLVALGGLLAWETDRRRAIAAAATAAVLVLALALSFSLTSFAALLVGLLVLVWARLGTRVAVAAVAVTLVAGVAFEVIAGSSGTEVSSGGAGRQSLITGGIKLAKQRPAWGSGSGSFGEAFYTRIQQAKTTTSHDTPIQVAAEQGAIGLLVYAALVVCALAVLFGGGVRGSPARSVIAALFVAMLVHTLGYASFLEDPATWAILAIGLALLRGAPPSPEPA